METEKPTQQDRIEALLRSINTKVTFVTFVALFVAMIFLCRLMLPDAPWW